MINLKQKMGNSYIDQFKNYIATAESEQTVNREVILLIDGLNLFLRAFSVVPTLNTNGEHTGAVIGFFNTIRKLVREHSPSEVIIVFDGKGGSVRRRKLYSEYKEKRVSVGTFNRFEEVKGLANEGESMKRQLVTVLQSLEHLPVRTVVIDGVEADDVVSYIAVHLLSQDAHKIIASSDKDYYQLVREDISVYSLHKKTLYTLQNIHEHIGYLPKNFLTLRCFTGDISDNINGVHRVGEKGLNKHFQLNATDKEHTIDSIVQEAELHVKNGTKVKLYQNIAEQKYIVYRNYNLMQLEEPPMSGQLSSHIRTVLDQPLNSYSRYAFYDLLRKSGIEFTTDDVSTWDKLAKKTH